MIRSAAQGTVRTTLPDDLRPFGVEELVFGLVEALVGVGAGKNGSMRQRDVSAGYDAQAPDEP